MTEGIQRRLAAIVSADVVGYSRLMGNDEAGTLRRLNAHRSEQIDPLIAKHGGRIVKTTGDGLLLEFPSVVAAVECCVAVQEGMAERNNDAGDEAIRFRVGVHLGDVIVEGDDIFGDGVNIAARLQEIGDTDGITISSNAHDSVNGRIKAGFVDGGDQVLKNIARPVRVWRWSPGQITPAETAVAGSDEPLSLPDKPSIAVLPFDNMSGDPEQEFFADGIAEDVITALSRFRSLFVIARNSTFTFKGQAVDITQIAHELGVRYVVEGSVRKAGNRVRITAQLIDATNGNHLWADRFDGNLDDIFDLQDEITERIVTAVAPEIAAHEREQAWRKRPEDLNAWGLLQRGMAHHYRQSRDHQRQAIELFRQSIATDPDFAAAHANLAFQLSLITTHGSSDRKRDEVIAEARGAAEQAVALNPDEPVGRLAMGRLHVFDGDIAMALSEMAAAVRSNPNYDRCYQGLAWAYHYGAGEAEQALPHYDTGLRLSPIDPIRWSTLMLRGSALRFLGRHDEAILSCREACRIGAGWYLPHMHLSAALAEAGHEADAAAALARACERESRLSISFIRDSFYKMHETTLESLLTSLSKAGLQ